MATHSSILAWEIPQTEKSDGLQSIGSPKSWTHLSNSPPTTVPLYPVSFSSHLFSLPWYQAYAPDNKSESESQLCLALCNPIRGILQARTLE